MVFLIFDWTSKFHYFLPIPTGQVAIKPFMVFFIERIARRLGGFARPHVFHGVLKTAWCLPFGVGRDAFRGIRIWWCFEKGVLWYPDFRPGAFPDWWCFQGFGKLAVFSAGYHLSFEKALMVFWIRQFLAPGRGSRFLDFAKFRQKIKFENANFFGGGESR